MKLSHSYKTKLARDAGSQANRRRLALALLGGLAALSSTVSAFAGDGDQTDKQSVPIQTAPVLEAPAWLTDLSLGVKETYDENVFLTGVDRNYLPTYSVPTGSVVALKNVHSWITTISPKIGLNFAPLLGDQTVFQVLSLGYAPDFNIYQNTPSESYNVHRFAANIKGQTDDVTFNLDDSLNYIQGSSYGPTYPGDLLSAFATGNDRERRQQIQDRANFSVQYDQPNWFIRPTASFLDYSLNTTQIFYPGYQNYINRYDVNGGLDLGYKVQPHFAFTLGYRYGHQDQGEFKFASEYPTIGIAAAHSPNDYQRVLFGFEGDPLKWLTVKLQIGPDFRTYDTSAPIPDKHRDTYYGEGSLTAKITSKDTLTFKYKQWEWECSTGLVPYFDSTFDLAYTRQITKALSFTLGAKALGANYNPNTVNGQDADLLGERCDRDDWEYVGSVGVQYAFNSHLTANVTYSYERGVSSQGGLTGPVSDVYPHRGFSDNLVSVGATLKF